MGGKNQHLSRRRIHHNLASSLQTVHQGHREIHYDNFRMEAHMQAYGLTPIFCFSDNLNISLGFNE